MTDMCFNCLQPWNGSNEYDCGNGDCSGLQAVSKFLAECDTTDCGGIMAPSLRMCPGCTTVIQHGGNCKHMNCTTCSTAFCFRCMRTRDKKEGWGRCGAFNDECELYPRQTKQDIQNIYQGKSSWQSQTYTST